MNQNKIELSGIFSEGYGFVPKKLMRAKDINSSTKLVLCYLLSFTGAGINCFPNIEDIARDLNISKRTVIRCIQSAIDNFYIKKHKKYLGQGKGSSNLYEMIFMKNFGSDKLSQSNLFEGDKNDTLEVTPGNRNNNINNNIYIQIEKKYFELYKKLYDQNPVYKYPPNRKIIKETLKSLSENEIIKIIEIASTDNWVLKNKVFNLKVILSENVLNRLRLSKKITDINDPDYYASNYAEIKNPEYKTTSMGEINAGE